MTSLKIFHTGMIETNTYLITDTDTKEMAIVDPASFREDIAEEIEENGSLKLILLTHGHYDHIGGVSDFMNRFPDAKVYICEKDEICLTDDNFNLSSKMFNRKFPHFSANLIKEGDTLTLGNTEITFIETPGHTSGSGCFIFDDTIISGDTLFAESCGRTDFPNSSPKDMLKSLIRLSQIEGEYKVYPGHGPSSTLSHEKKYNPYMNTNYEDIY